jgi:hypothetical protein
VSACTHIVRRGGAGSRRRAQRAGGGCEARAYAEESPEAMETAVYRCGRQRFEEMD